mmetsp:Transcript_23230/g.37300  ORF Transcript_23230/g.37300 Transcript_23230/m.37300 type:complete len:209 (-) Transcript_23230:1631-2257(-)
MPFIQQRVVEVDSGERLKSGVMGVLGIAIAKQNVVKPLGYLNVGIHQLPDALQHSLEVVLLRLSLHNHVKSRVHRVPPACRTLLGMVALLACSSIQGVLGRIEMQADPAHVASSVTLGIGVKPIDDLAIFIQHAHNFSAADVCQTEVVGAAPLFVRRVLAHLKFGGDGEEKDDIVLTEILPVLAQTKVAHAIKRIGRLAQHVRRPGLA